MNWNKLKTKRFWVAVGSAIIMILQACGITIDAPVVNELICTVCTILVFFGFLEIGSTDDMALMDDSEESDDTASSDVGDENDDKNASESEETNILDDITDAIELIGTLIGSASEKEDVETKDDTTE